MIRTIRILISVLTLFTDALVTWGGVALHTRATVIPTAIVAVVALAIFPWRPNPFRRDR